MADIEELQNTACDTLRVQAEECAKVKSGNGLMAAKKVLAAAVADKMADFVMQDDTGELARSVVKEGKSLSGCVEAVMNGVSRDTGAVSDIEVYTRAIRYYLPEASVRCSFRCVIPQEIDDDLAFLDSPVAEVQDRGAPGKILNLFVGEMDV